jgi:hypothetical protein
MKKSKKTINTILSLVLGQSRQAGSVTYRPEASGQKPESKLNGINALTFFQCLEHLHDLFPMFGKMETSWNSMGDKAKAGVFSDRITGWTGLKYPERPVIPSKK